MTSVTLTDTSRVNYYGRNRIAADRVTFMNTCSGFETRFSGRTLTAVFTRRGPGPSDGEQTEPPTRLRLRIYRDGDTSPENSRVLVLDESTDGVAVTLATFEDDGEHTVLVRKMNYDRWGYVELRALSCDGAFGPAPARPEKKLLIYGDSLTVGYGVEYRATGDRGGDCPEKEDGTRAYGTLYCDSIGAEMQAYCCSGVSVGIPCWRRETVMGNGYWRQYAYFDTGSVYDMTRYVPDLIICNLGSNDADGLKNGASAFGNGTPFASDGFYRPSDLENAFADFIRAMKQLYPASPVVMICGMSSYDKTVHECLTRAVDGCGFPSVYCLKMDAVEHSENAGHPTLAGQRQGFLQLAAFIADNGIGF